MDDGVLFKFIDGDWLDIAPPDDDTDVAEIRRCGFGTVGGRRGEGEASSLLTTLQGGVDDLDEDLIG
ncbi:hypothetical protein BLA29_007831, partial [Euroglyphus maynei]